MGPEVPPTRHAYVYVHLGTRTVGRAELIVVATGRQRLRLLLFVPLLRPPFCSLPGWGWLPGG